MTRCFFSFEVLRLASSGVFFWDTTILWGLTDIKLRTSSRSIATRKNRSDHWRATPLSGAPISSVHCSQRLSVIDRICIKWSQTLPKFPRRVSANDVDRLLIFTSPINDLGLITVDKYLWGNGRRAFYEGGATLAAPLLSQLALDEPRAFRRCLPRYC